MYAVNQKVDLQIFLAPKQGCNLTIGPCYRIDKPTPYSVVSSGFYCRHLILQFSVCMEKLLNLIHTEFYSAKLV